MLDVHSSYLHNNRILLKQTASTKQRSKETISSHRTSAQRPKSLWKRRKQFSVLIIGEKRKAVLSSSLRSFSTLLLLLQGALARFLSADLQTQ
jgi:hypothetical protein